MTNRKISEFTALTAPASTDTIPIIDQSSSGADKNKKITYADLLSKAPDGSASAPSFSFSSDPNTGISGGSDTLTLSTGGSGRLTISSAGLVTIPGDLTVSGTTTTIDTTNLTVKDKNIEIAKGNGNDAAVDGAGITIDSTDGDKTWNWVDSTDSWTSSEHIDLASGKVLKVAGTQVLSATNFTGTSAIATNVTVADESSDTTCNVLFVTAETGNLPPKTGTNLTFNSSSGALTATSFVGDLTGNVTGDLTGDVTGDLTGNVTGNLTGNVTGNLTGNVTGNTSGSSGSCTGNAATATSLQTARTIAGVSFDGTANISLNNNAITNGAGYITATLTNEEVQDIVGGMLTGNTETGITVTYQDGDGTIDFVVGTLNQDTTGNAATATALETARTINGTSFDGSANITVTAAAGTLTGTELKSTVVTSSLTSVGTLTSLTTSGNILMTGTGAIDVASGTTGQRPGSPSAGMFRFNSTTSEFEGYDGSAWGEIGGSTGTSGTADLLDIASSSGTGGGSATFNGSAYRFKLVTKGTSTAVTPTNAEILRVSINGVMQQPNDGTGQGDMTEGYVVSGTDIIFDSAPPSGATYFIVNMGTQVAIGNATTNTIADESSDTTCFPLFATAATGDLGLKSGSNLTFNSATGTLGATVFSGSGASLTNLPSSALTGALPAIDGSALTGVSSQKADGCVTENSLTISNNYTMTTNKSGLSAGDITIANGVTVTIPSGSRYVIV